MSRRGAETRAGSREELELVVVEALGHDVVLTAQKLLSQGLEAGEACTLLLHASAALGRMPEGISREQFLAIAAELWDECELEDDGRVTAPGGSA